MQERVEEGIGRHCFIIWQREKKYDENKQTFWMEENSAVFFDYIRGLLFQVKFAFDPLIATLDLFEVFKLKLLLFFVLLLLLSLLLF